MKHKPATPFKLQTKIINIEIYFVQRTFREIYKDELRPGSC